MIINPQYLKRGVFQSVTLKTSNQEVTGDVDTRNGVYC